MNETMINEVNEKNLVMAPTLIKSVATFGCIAGSHSESSRRIATISAAYNITALKEANAKINGAL